MNEETLDEDRDYEAEAQTDRDVEQYIFEQQELRAITLDEDDTTI